MLVYERRKKRLTAKSRTQKHLIWTIFFHLAQIVILFLSQGLHLRLQSAHNAYRTKKCEGFQPFVKAVYTEIPCHLLHNINVVVENHNLHHTTCAQNNYVLCDENSFHEVNKVCNDLKYSPGLKKLLDCSKKGYTDPRIKTMNHQYLSHKQLSEKAILLQEQKRELRLQLMNSKFKNSKLCDTVSLHNRFLVEIADNKVLRLQQLVKAALNNNRSISYILSKVMNAIDGL